MKDIAPYFRSSIYVTVLGLFLGGTVGYVYTGTWAGAGAAFFLTAVLAVLEVSLSFDNAVVNASVLREMTPTWRHRFITWGMLVAVFGMRIVFPLVLVSLIARIDPWSALVLATTRPKEYADIMLSSHSVLAGFGGSFLMMVALNYFFDHDKKEHWLGRIEAWFASVGKIQGVEIALCLILFYLLSTRFDEPVKQTSFLTAGIFGVVTYIFIDGVSAFLSLPEHGRGQVERASAAMFLYLEILDASFSFDGVVGAFALTSNIFIIAAGLGIGAMFVRSLTILMVDKNTLGHFRFLEQGAFYAIGALAFLMVLDVFTPVPEVVTGLIGAFIILISVWSSRRGLPDAH